MRAPTLGFAVLWLLSSVAPAAAAHNAVRLAAGKADQTGRVPDGAAQPSGLVLANEPDGGTAGVVLEFDLSAVPHARTPLARVELPAVGKVAVKRPGREAGTVRGVLHALAGGKVAGEIVVRPGGPPFTYVIDVTSAVNEVLARPTGRRLRLEVVMTGQPAWYEVYALPTGPGAAAPTLEVASPAGWSDDFEKRMAPLDRGPVVYRESCLPLTADRGKDVSLRLLYPVKAVVEVVHNGTGEKLREGRDWELRDGTVVLPPGTAAPVQNEAEFFTATRKGKDGTETQIRSAIRLMEGTWYHERQVEVTYEPAGRDWRPPASPPGDLPRTRRLLAEKKPVRVVLFGDSISAGGNASKFQGAWPYQPAFGELAARELERLTGSRVALFNHSRGGGTSAYGLTQAESQVGWFRPDLAVVAFGMNDRSPERAAGYKANLEKTIDAVRAVSPETEFVLVTSMLNNPKQPAGNDPAFRLREDALAIRRPGVAFADVGAVHRAMLARKDYLDLSGNGANHPNDFLHRAYARTVVDAVLPAARGDAILK